MLNTRQRRLFAVLATAVAVAAAAPTGRAQEPDFLQGRGLGTGLNDAAGLPGRPERDFPIPTGNPGSHGFFAFTDLLYLTQTWTLGNQTVAVRGFRDTTGLLTGTAGQFVGSGREAVNTNDFGRRTYMPGYNIGIGYKSDDGTTYVARFLRTPRYDYVSGASLTAPNASGPNNLADTFLFSPVFNFPPQYSGPAFRLGNEPTTPVLTPIQLLYGIWNGSGTIALKYTQQYTEADLGVRIPVFETEYSKVYGLAGGRMNWFFERFKWRTQAFAAITAGVDSTTGIPLGQADPSDVANYTNTLSQRMYGPYLGASHEIYLGKNFSFSSDVTGALLVNLTKERVKYELGSQETQNKRSLNELDLSPSAAGNANLWWYPASGVQVRVGYQATTFFNTKRMEQPIGFNYSAPDPVYSTQYFRIVHGFNVGLGLFF